MVIDVKHNYSKLPTVQVVDCTEERCKMKVIENVDEMLEEIEEIFQSTMYAGYNPYGMEKYQHEHRGVERAYEIVKKYVKDDSGESK